MNPPPKTNPNDSAMPSSSKIIAFDSEFVEYVPGLTKREKLIFDLYVKFSSQVDTVKEAGFYAKCAIESADILFAELAKESK